MCPIAGKGTPLWHFSLAPQASIEQRDIAAAFKISRPLCSAIVRGHIWNPEVKLTTGDEMRDRVIAALDTGCRRGEMMKIQNTHVDWSRQERHAVCARRIENHCNEQVQVG